MVVENAFGRLKGRWRCLLKRMDYYNINHIIAVVGSCIVLHNLCKLYGDSCDSEWYHAEPLYHQRNTLDSTRTSNTNNYAHRIREALTEYLTNH